MRYRCWPWSDLTSGWREGVSKPPLPLEAGFLWKGRPEALQHLTGSLRIFMLVMPGPCPAREGGDAGAGPFQGVGRGSFRGRGCSPAVQLWLGESRIYWVMAPHAGCGWAILRPPLQQAAPPAFSPSVQQIPRFSVYTREGQTYRMDRGLSLPWQVTTLKRQPN